MKKFWKRSIAAICNQCCDLLTLIYETRQQRDKKYRNAKIAYVYSF